MLRFAFALTLAAAPAWADIAKPDTLVDTLVALRAAIGAEGFAQAEIDMINMNIKVDGTDGGSVINPDNIHRSLLQAGSDAERQQVMDRFVASLLIATAAIPNVTVLPTAQVFPVVRHVDYLASIDDTGRVVQAHGFGDMDVFFVVDYPDSTASVSPDMMATAGLTAIRFRRLRWKICAPRPPPSRSRGAAPIT